MERGAGRRHTQTISMPSGGHRKDTSHERKALAGRVAGARDAAEWQQEKEWSVVFVGASTNVTVRWMLSKFRATDQDTGRGCRPNAMGNKIVTFTDQQLEDYQDCTFFTRKEILRVHQRFHEASPDLVPLVMTEGQASTLQVPRERIEKLPELVENPFKGRMCEAFSRDGDGNLTFEDFLDLLSVFSEQAPRDIKVYYAFKIYDYDRDGFIGQSDLLNVITALTRNELTVEEHQQIAEKVIEEADVDGDGKLSYLEFEHVITRAPDFISTFHIRI